MQCMGQQPVTDRISSHDKGQEREEPYEATSLTYGSESAAGRATDPPTVTQSVWHQGRVSQPDAMGQGGAGVIDDNTEDPKRFLQCPACGSRRVARILYGLYELNEELERKFLLGGCIMITGKSPRWACVDCRHRWGTV
jgi:hypothetical protein